MIAPTVTWRPQQGRFCNGKNGFAGRWHAFTLFWDSCRSRPDTPYRLRCDLPGLKQDMGHYVSEEAGMKQAQAALEHWIRGLALPPKSGG